MTDVGQEGVRGWGGDRSDFIKVVLEEGENRKTTNGDTEGEKREVQQV